MNTSESLFNSLLHFSDHLLYCSKYDVNLPEVILINLTVSAESLPGSIIYLMVFIFYYCSIGTVIFTPKTLLFSTILCHMVSCYCCLGTGLSCAVIMFPTFSVCIQSLWRCCQTAVTDRDEILQKHLRYTLMRSFQKVFLESLWGYHSLWRGVFTVCWLLDSLGYFYLFWFEVFCVFW